ncbi:hypothetical protein CEUSTIGMA_g5564.t1 [Chlamydomonas eustigma]|uniref:Cation/H+ exchanger domain-containing protein n=1 Tax=Chlamydomonas eustigma TaxID=1157962 RepID=A0A250X5F0_9CHLO|nr:hypothetical protein CEUSTIGMA_g5564.t1 [Chlamydomonas eustigma]|eukprot:GAX78122.1 hypothetical protein CEUSTIGMA_g5564.t1 [Chlamydomonas eustigma]
MYEIENQKALKYFKGLATITLIFVITYAACYFIFGNTFSIPSGSCFAVILVWVIGHVGGFLAVQCQIPALLGMLAFGVLIENVPGDLLRGYQHSWAVHIKSFGLATILMRAGLKINYTQAFRQAPWSVVLLGAVPVFVEGFLDAAIFNTVRYFGKSTSLSICCCMF